MTLTWRGRSRRPLVTITFTPWNRQAEDLLAEHTELTLIRAYKHADDLKTDLDRLAVQVEGLLRERAQLVATLRTFYQSDRTASCVPPVLRLAEQLDPTLTDKTAPLRAPEPR
jgi:hypothetical protein